MVARTSQLPRISLDSPGNVIGKNTVDCMKSGVIYGYASCIDGMLERISDEMNIELDKINVIATGGLARVIVPECKNKIIIDNALLLKGLKIIYDKNEVSDVKR